MSLVFLVFLVLLRKKYNISMKMMIVLHILFTITGAFGASLGAVLSGMTWAGKRLHMLMAIDTITLTLFCFLLKQDAKRLGDYLAIPVVTVCAAAKVGCVISGCCYGVVLFVNENGTELRFPSAAVELSCWILLSLGLFFIAQKGYAKGFLWPIALIWFGVIRFFVDFMRGGFLERHLKILGLPISAFWSLIVMLMGIVYLICSFRRYRGHMPNMKDIFRLIFGLKV